VTSVYFSDAPLFTGGEAIASYELKKIMFYDGYSPENDGVVVYYGPARENHVEGLSAGKVYLFLVRAYNTIGVCLASLIMILHMPPNDLRFCSLVHGLE
jgi:hypothetical protein